MFQKEQTGVAAFDICLHEGLTHTMEIENLDKITVGSYFRFGSYPLERDGEIAPIEWLVLKRDVGKALLISRHAIDCCPYNTESTNVTWETCSLREWLNKSFIEKAFNQEEQKRIIVSTIKADSNSLYDTMPCNDTSDKIFLLSVSEVNQFFKSDDERKCAATGYAISKGSITTDNNRIGGSAACWWWLRSPGLDLSSAAFIYGAGSIYGMGRPADCDNISVRPAMWINLGSIDNISRPSKKSSGFEILIPNEDNHTAESRTKNNDESAEIKKPIAETTKKEEEDTKYSAPSKNADKKVGGSFTLQPGDYIEFGSYPQGRDGKILPIEWLVLKNDGSKVLLISRYALDCQPYTHTGSTWETCSLRQWLNGSFLDTAFNLKEKRYIKTTAIARTELSEGSARAATSKRGLNDRSFLLSIDEANEFFNSNFKRQCAPTDYAITRGARTNEYFKKDSRGTCCWWLRSPGFDDNHGAIVNFAGNVSVSGSIVDYSFGCVRPALCINSNCRLYSWLRSSNIMD